MHSAIWRCESCQAVTANLAVLRQYLKNDVIKVFWSRAITANKNTAKKCPSCRHSLREFTVQQNGQNINLDICRRCQLVWFDKGELDAFPKTQVEQLPPEAKQYLAMLKVRSEAEQGQFSEETAGKVFAILAQRRFLPLFPGYVGWIIYIFAGLVRFVVDLKGWLWAAAVIICGIAICIGASIIFRPHSTVYPENILSPDYQRNMNYLIGAVRQVPPDFSKIKGGFLCSYIPVMNDKDFPGFADKLRQELHEAAANDFLFHRIVVGGMTVRDIDEPLLNACKRLPVIRQHNIEIVIVAPSTISDDTKRILEKKGLQILRP